MRNDSETMGYDFKEDEIDLKELMKVLIKDKSLSKNKTLKVDKKKKNEDNKEKLKAFKNNGINKLEFYYD